jgi:hypothetical protein
VYYYELHEGDEDLMSDVILACEDEMSPDDFFDLVQEVRVQVQDSFDEDTLVEAIAVELERNHGYTFVSDERLIASVFVSRRDEENLLITSDPDDRMREEGDEPDDEADDPDAVADDPDAVADDPDAGADDPDDLPDYRSVIAEFDPRTGSN